MVRKDLQQVSLDEWRTLPSATSMSLPISIGDVLLLSSLAWKIGCAFTSGRAGAPAEFREVENELQSLKASLSLLADTLDADDSILSRADRRTVNGLGTILSSCNQVSTSLTCDSTHAED